MNARLSRVGTAALTATAISAAGLVATTTGVLLNANGFQSQGHHQTVLSITCFLGFVIGGLVAVILAAAAALHWRERRAGKTVALYVLLAIAVIIFTNLVNANG